MNLHLPSWPDLWGDVGPLVGVALGAILTAWLSWHWQRKQSAMDSKKQEYQQLLDVLGSCVNEVISLKHHVYAPAQFSHDPIDNFINQPKQRLAEIQFVNNQITAAFLRASRALRDRLFIDGYLKAHNILEDWKKLETMANLPGSGESNMPGLPVFETAKFSQAWAALSEKIREAARKDLG